MLHIDTTSMLTYDVDQVCSMDRGRISDPEKFRGFANGIEMREEFLLHDRWKKNSATTTKGVFDIMMHEMLPLVYDPAHLASLGGLLGLKITDVGGYSITAVSHRVVVLSDLPIDWQTGQEVIDFEISGDVFMAFCRGLVLRVSEDLLEEDDEFEDRPVSDFELNMIGMPAGGFFFGSSFWSKVFKTKKDCGAKASVATVCAAKASACGAAADALGACGVKLGACGAKHEALGACGGKVDLCTVKGSVGDGCLTKASACGAKGEVGSLCAAKASACGAKAGLGETCGAKGTVCGAAANFGACGGKVGLCGAKAGPELCGAKAGLCPANLGGICGADLPLGDPFSFCAVNVIPVLPSC